jgi:hypothetical protein
MSVGTSLLIVLAGLQVETSTPDSLCPTLKAVREAVEARVGEVRGGDYLASYRMVRSSGEGGDAIELELRGENNELLIARTLPLGELACSDADVAIALVLERYFQQLTAVAPAAPLPATDPDAENKATAAVAPGPASERAEEPPAPIAEQQTESIPPKDESDGLALDPPHWALTVTAGATLEPNPFLGLNLDYSLAPNWELALGALIPLAPDTEKLSDTFSIDTYNPVAVLGLRFRRSFSPWSLAGGPIVTSWLQWARPSESADVEMDTASAQVRLLWGLGAEGLVRWAISSRTQLELGLRVAPLLPPSRNFTIDESDGSKTKLPLEPSWFGSLAAGARFEF